MKKTLRLTLAAVAVASVCIPSILHAAAQVDFGAIGGNIILNQMARRELRVIW